MTTNLLLSTVFTPTGFPAHTYVDRNDDRVERAIRNAFETPGTVVSISGPSKSGKTVLVKRIVGEEKLIQVSGGSVSSTDVLWNTIVARMRIPTELTETATKSSQNTRSISGGVSLPFATGSGSNANARGAVQTFSRRFAANNLDQIVEELSGSDKVVFVDDFRYMNRSLQGSIAKQIKYAAEAGVKFCIASVPHRSDDVVRSNSELRGRTVNNA